MLLQLTLMSLRFGLGSKNKPVVDVLAATIAENTAEVGMTADEMAAVAAAAAAGLHTE